MAHRAGFSGRRKVVIAAWKTYLDSAQSEALAVGIRNWAAGRPDARYELLLSPTALHAVLVGRAAGKTAAICAQDLDPVGRGAYTGQVPPQLLTDAGCSHVLLGHSEARRHGGDTDHTLGRKVEAALDNSDLHVILCIGESREQRDGGFTLDTLESQLRGGARRRIPGFGRRQDRHSVRAGLGHKLGGAGGAAGAARRGRDTLPHPGHTGGYAG